MGLKFREERLEDKLVFYLEGELVAKEKMIILSAILEAVQRESDVSFLVLDLSKLDYVDSSGLGMFLDLRQRLSKENKRFILIGLNDYVKRLLNITHLIDSFEIYENMDDLLSSLKKDDIGIQEGRMEIPSDLEYVQDASRRIISVLQKYHLPEQILKDMRLVVEELVINGIRHGNQFSSDKFVLFSYRATPSDIVIEVRDEGDGFDYENVEGKGLKLVKSIVDGIEFLRGGTHVKIYKKFK